MIFIRRQRIIAIGSIFGAGLIHSLLPPIDIWIRSAMMGFAGATIACLLNALLPHPPRAYINRFLLCAAEQQAEELAGLNLGGKDFIHGQSHRVDN
jgi:hypothetical protein